MLWITVLVYLYKASQVRQLFTLTKALQYFIDLQSFLDKQLDLYKKEEWEEGHSYFPIIQEHLKKEKMSSDFQTESQDVKKCRDKCVKINDEIKVLLKKQQKLIKKKFIDCQIDIALLNM